MAEKIECDFCHGLFTRNGLPLHKLAKHTNLTLPGTPLKARQSDVSVAQKEKEVKSMAEPISQTEDTAKLQDDNAKLEEEVIGLRAEVARLESPEHENEVVTNWLNNLDGADPELKVELGLKLGLDKMFKEAEVAEGKEPVAVAEVKEPAPEPAHKPEVCWKDPGDDANYKKVQGLPIWILDRKA